MLNELWTVVQLACTFIIALGGAGAVVIGIIKWAHKPTDTRDEILKKHDELLDNDNKRLKALEEGQIEMQEANRILMKSMLALMSHSIDGNHMEELKQTRDDLQEYLIRR